jgi:UTP--glucose-1-phosphate uridylyltransferase
MALHYPDGFEPFLSKMRSESIAEAFIESFAFYYGQLARGETGLIPEDEIEPVESLPDIQSVGKVYRETGLHSLSKTVVIKLNGGLGTSMGLDRAKSLLEVREGHCFLDVIAQQAIYAGVPLLLMNSFATDDDSLRALEPYPELRNDLPLRFVQHKEPKIAKEGLVPVSWPPNPALEWCPPGHGDLYTALVTSGALDGLLEAGYKYAFVSNSDNLGAVLEPDILGFFVKNRLPFLMEVADRTEMDRKGGHLARLLDGRLVLRESAQCPDEDLDSFQDVSRHRYFNTNNLWFDLATLRDTMAKQTQGLALPMIRNSKTVDPRDKGSTPVFQLETAMGAAISVFDSAQAIRVPRSRFAPVKTTNQLLAIRSDAFVRNEDSHVLPNPKRRLGPLVVKLDSTYYKMVTDFEARFPFGSPSLVSCESLSVDGDIKFGRNVTCRGTVNLLNESGTQVEIADGTELEGKLHYPKR